jgi:hypothetical protein
MSPFIFSIVVAVLIGALIFIVGIVTRKRKIILIGAPGALLLITWFLLASSRPNPQKTFDKFFGASNRGVASDIKTLKPTFMDGHFISFRMRGADFDARIRPQFPSLNLPRLPTCFWATNCPTGGLLQSRRLDRRCIVRSSIAMSICFTFQLRKWRMRLSGMILGKPMPNHAPRLCAEYLSQLRHGISISAASRVVTFLVCALVVGCSQPSVKPRSNRPVLLLDRAVLLLDNHGGVGHSGRRIELRTDGSYTDTIYSDFVGDEHTKAGHYALNPERTHLMLSPEGGETQDLYRVDYDGKQYWVREVDRRRITKSSESWLRQVSLRAVPP